MEILAELDLERDKTFLAPYGRIVVSFNYDHRFIIIFRRLAAVFFPLFGAYILRMYESRIRRGQKTVRFDNSLLSVRNFNVVKFSVIRIIIFFF